MGGIMGVGRGSERKPRFIHMKYTPKGTPTRKILYGKGVTFDAGVLHEAQRRYADHAL